MAQSYLFNIYRMSAGFFCLFCAFNTAQNLESTVVSDNQLVNAALATLYGIFTVFCVFAPRVVSVIGPKWAMTLGGVPYVLLVFANMKPSWYTFMPAFGAVGLGAAVLWTAQGIYMSRCAIREAAATGEAPELVTSRFNSVFWSAFQFNAALGLIASSIVFTAVSDLSTAVNYLFLGFGILGCVGVAILSTIVNVAPTGAGAADAVDDDDGGVRSQRSALTANDHAARAGKASDDDGSDSKSADDGAGGEVSLYATLHLVGTSRAMQLLVPIVFYCGASLGFHFANFPLLYQDEVNSDGDITNQKLMGKRFVGYVGATFFLVNSAASWAWGRLIPRIGRRPLFVVTLLTHAAYFGVVITLTFTQLGLPHEGGAAFATIFGLAAIFAVGDSVLESQVPAIVQSPTFFASERDRDAANSNVRMWQSLGFTAQFALGIAFPKNVFLQAAILAPLSVLALFSLWVLDTCVRPIDTGGAARGGKATGSEAAYAGVATADDGRDA